MKKSTPQFLQLIMVCTYLTAHTTLAEPVARLFSKQGIVERKAIDSASWNSIEIENTFQESEQLRTGAKSKAAVLFVDGIMVRLNENSKMQFKSTSSNSKQSLSLLDGVGYFFSRDPKEIPDIETPTVSASVRGTEFVITVKDDKTTISVLDGRVACNNEFGSVVVGSGEEAITERGHAPIKRILANPKDAVQWALYYPNIIFDKELEDFKQLHNLSDGSSVSSQLKEAAELVSIGQIDKANQILEKLTKELATLSTAVSKQALSVIYAQESIISIVKDEKNIAKNYITKARSLDDNSLSLLLASSYFNQAQFDLEAAKLDVTRGLTIDPNNQKFLARKAELEMTFGNIEEALNNANRALELAPDNAYALAISGFAYLSRYDTDSAGSAFKKSISLDQSSGLPFLGLGLTNIREGNLEKGRELLQQAAHLEPNVSLYRSYLGKAFFEEEKESHSAKEYARAIEIDRNDPTPYLYRAFYNLSKNQPVDALNDIEDSIRLNENRAVYRSRLLLDQDQSVRSAGLAQVFSNLGFNEAARIEAIKSINQDYANYSAHLFLSKSYEDSDDVIQAGLSEYLIARLLSPVNFNLILPTSNSTVALNEYSALFERPLIRTNILGEGRTQDDFLSGRISNTGLFGNWGYALDYQFDHLSGYRNNDFNREHTLYSSVQYQLTSDDTLLLDANLEVFDAGDIELSYNDSLHNDDLKTELKDYFIRFGFNHKFGPQTNLIGQALFNDSNFKIHDPTLERVMLANTIDLDEVQDTFQVLSETDQRVRFDSKGIRFDTQLIHSNDLLSSVSGIGVLDSTQDQVETGEIISSDLPGLSAQLASAAENGESSKRVFSYTTWHLNKWADIQTAISFSHLHLSGSPIFVPFSENIDTETYWSPKVGLSIYPTTGTTVRSAYYETIGNSGIRELEQIEPTTVSGFNQVFFDILPGALSRNYSLGIDQKFAKSTYTGIEATHRDIKLNSPTPYSIINIDLNSGNVMSQDMDVIDEDAHIDEDILRTYLYQVLNNKLSGTTEYAYVLRDDNFFSEEAKTHRVKMGLNYFEKCGFFAFTSATWRNQQLDNFDFISDGDASEQFWLLDSGIGFRLPRRSGAITLALNNILDENFSYLPTGIDPLILPGIGARIAFSYNF